MHVYSVAVCGERLAFEKAVTLPQLKWDFRQEWSQCGFFIAPTQLNCDEDFAGKIVGTVERLRVVIAYSRTCGRRIRPRRRGAFQCNARHNHPGSLHLTDTGLALQDYLADFWRSISIRLVLRPSAALRLPSSPIWALCCMMAGHFSRNFCPDGRR
jgi:hypothetical protein